MYSTGYNDLGTPRVDGGPAGKLVTLEIDGQPVTVPEGTSIMRAAASVGRNVPKLCATDTLKAFGSCRLCLVEIEGRRGYPASCTTLVADGIKVNTESPKLTQLRRSVMELYISDHPARLRDLSRQRPLRAAGHGRRARRHRHALRPRRREPPARREGREQSVLHLRPVGVHRVLALRAGVRRGAGHLRADDSGPRLQLEGLREPERIVPRVGVRLVRRLRRSVSDRRADREVAHPARPSRTRRDDDVRVLRRRLLVQRGSRRTTRSSAWRRTATATRTTATRASRAASRSATPRTPTASRRR